MKVLSTGVAGRLFQMLAVLWVALAAVGTAQAAEEQGETQERPNILVIFSDDVGHWNVSAYSRGQMGYRTPNIDRIAKEGAIFTDY